MARDDKPKKKDPFENVDVEIERQGTQIVLPASPAPMELRTAIKQIERKIEEEETEIDVYESVNAFPWDGAQAFMKAMRRIYGWTQAVPTPGMFGPQPPTFVTVKTGPGVNDNMQIIWGSFTLPNVSGRLQTTVQMERDGRVKFVLRGKCKRKEHRAIKELADLTREIAISESIYKGKAIRLKCDGDGDINWHNEPEFFDTSRTRPQDLIFAKDVEEQVVTNVFTPIEKTQQCLSHNIPLSRGVLCEGPFGVGKTLLSAVTAKKCEENGWTYIVIDDATAIHTALEFAQLYAPAVVFAEDIDRVVSGERTSEMDRILNTIDGVTGKSNQIITILTTNNVEEIHPAMLRPGRLDAVISIRPPDAEAAQRLMRTYGGNLIADSDPLEEAGKELDGAIPAVIREVVERAKLFALSRANGAEIQLRDGDLAASARGMNQHLALLNRTKEEPSAEENAGIALRKLLAPNLQEMEQSVGMMGAHGANIGRVLDLLRQKLDELESSGNANTKLFSELDKIQRVLRPMHTKLQEIHQEVS